MMSEVLTCIDWESAKDMRRCASYIQSQIIKERGLLGFMPRYALVQRKLVPSQTEILDGLVVGQYREYINAA